MYRAVGVALGLVVFLQSSSWAADHTGKVKEIDADKLTITITVEQKDLDFKIDEKVLVYPLTNNPGFPDRSGQSEVEGGLKGIKPGAQVRIFTEKRGGEEVVIAIGLYLFDPSKKGRDRQRP